MRVGIHFVNFTLPGAPATLGPTLATTARIAEESGVSVFTSMDHWFQMEMMATSEDPMLEGYTSLGFLAGQTSTMTLGLLVTGVTYRHPGLLAKIVTTLDVLSGGRAQLGIGAAWYEREHRGLGVPSLRWPSASSAWRRRCRSACRCGAPTTGPMTGATTNWPRRSARHRPSARHAHASLIGGSGERKTLRLVARYADACNLFATSPTDIAHKLDVLARHCEIEGRDPATVDRTILALSNPLDDIDGFLALMARVRRARRRRRGGHPGGGPGRLRHTDGERVVPALVQLGP